jgi:MFS family permease
MLVFNTIVWYTLTNIVLEDTLGSLGLSTKETLLGIYYVGAAGSVVFGSMFLTRKRGILLLSWMLAGVVTTPFLATMTVNSLTINILMSFFLGISVGIGLPACLAYFADSTIIENRGIHGGITWSAIGGGTFVLALLIGHLEVASAFVGLSIWRAIGLVTFYFLRPNEKTKEPQQIPAYRSILRRRDMALYLIPWIMFVLINFTETAVLKKLFSDLYFLAGLIEFALIGIFAVIGGFLADLMGRKRVVITGFVTLGIGYAVLSLAPTNIISWCSYTVIDGFAWGMFACVFFMSVWGDLADDKAKEKYYTVGGLPYLLAGFLPVVFERYADNINPVAAFSLASFFLFVAVLPLMYAPETLPEKRMREIELKDYVEKAKKVKDKYV